MHKYIHENTNLICSFHILYKGSFYGMPLLTDPSRAATELSLVWYVVTVISAAARMVVVATSGSKVILHGSFTCVDYIIIWHCYNAGGWGRCRMVVQ